MIDKKYRSEYSGEQIDEAVTKINALDMTNYYNKEQIDAELEKKMDKSAAEETYYSKEEIDDQERFEDDAPNAQVSVGNLAIGTKLAGLSVKTIIKMMVYGEVSYPQLTDPSLTYKINGELFGIAGMEYILSGQLNFDRGIINPSYGTSGYRAGVPYKYEIGEKEIDSASLVQDFEYSIGTLIPGGNDVTLSVYYAQGEQPLDSVGAPYSSPYPAGLIRKDLVITGLAASFSGIDGGEIIEDSFSTELIPIDSRDYTNSGLFGDNGVVCGYQIKTPGANTRSESQIILLPENVNIYGVKSWNILSGGWDWFYGETAAETVAADTWIKTDEIISKEINGISVNYRKFRFNIDVYGSMDENYFRFFIKEGC